MKSAIVTGATGFIGKKLLKRLSMDGIKVYAIVRDESKIEEIEKFPNINIVVCPMENYYKLDRLIKVNDIDVFYHLAWNAPFGPERADYNVQLNNIKYTCDAIESANRINVKKFLFLGTVSQFQKTSNKYSGLEPNNIYGIAKSTTNNMIRNLAYGTGMTYISAIGANIYGPGQNNESFITFLIKSMLKNKKLSLTECTQKHDFIYIDDAVEALYLIGQYCEKENEYYIGNKQQIQLRNYVEKVKDTLKSISEINFGDKAYNGIEIDFSELNISLLYEEFSFEARVNFKDGIIKTTEWLERGEDS